MLQSASQARPRPPQGKCRERWSESSGHHHPRAPRAAALGNSSRAFTPGMRAGIKQEGRRTLLRKKNLAELEGGKEGNRHRQLRRAPTGKTPEAQGRAPPAEGAELTAPWVRAGCRPWSDRTDCAQREPDTRGPLQDRPLLDTAPPRAPGRLTLLLQCGEWAPGRRQEHHTPQRTPTRRGARGEAGL